MFKSLRIKQFWSWFVKNEKSFWNFERNPNFVLNLISSQGKSIKRGLTFELNKEKDGSNNLTVSADGVFKLFDLVQKIVDSAPRMDGWNVIAFRQKLNKAQLNETSLKIGDIELNPKNIRCFPFQENGKQNVIIYIDGVNDKNYTDVSYAGLIILDHVLGEYDCVTKVDSYDFHQMPTSESDLKELFPLLELSSLLKK